MLEEYTLNELPTERSTDTLIQAIDRIKHLEEENNKLKKALEKIMNCTYDDCAFKIAKEALK